MDSEKVLRDALRPNNEEVSLSVSEAFNQWRESRQRLKQIEEQILGNEEGSLIISNHAINPAAWHELQVNVVRVYHELFQCTVMAYRDLILQQGNRVAYHVYAKWNIEQQGPLLEFQDGYVYQTDVLFDMLYTVPRLGIRQCLILIEQSNKYFRRYPLPVDYVDRVEGVEIL